MRISEDFEQAVLLNKTENYLLEKNPEPSETEVRFALAGNLCRCTGYDKIIRSVRETAAELRASHSNEGATR